MDKYYKFPLYADNISIFTKDNGKAFDFLVDFSETEKNKLINKLNGDDTITLGYETILTCEDEFIKMGEIPILHVRGWGHLVDHPHHLSNEEAVLAQKDFLYNCWKRLSRLPRIELNTLENEKIEKEGLYLVQLKESGRHIILEKVPNESNLWICLQDKRFYFTEDIGKLRLINDD